MALFENQRGFSPLIVILAVLVLAGLGGTGYYVWSKNKDDVKKDTTSQNTNEDENQQDDEPAKKYFKLLEGKLTFVDDDTWKSATGGYWSAESGRCGRGTDNDQGCLDHKMLIPADETFSNPDQFQVNISVFTDDRQEGVSLEEWIDLEVGPGGKNPTKTYPALDGYKGYRYEVAYNENDIRLIYGVAANGKIIVIQSIFFNGSSGSFDSNNDYRPLISQVDELVESIAINS